MRVRSTLQPTGWWTLRGLDRRSGRPGLRCASGRAWHRRQSRGQVFSCSLIGHAPTPWWLAGPVSSPLAHQAHDRCPALHAAQEAWNR